MKNTPIPSHYTAWLVIIPMKWISSQSPLSQLVFIVTGILWVITEKKQLKVNTKVNDVVEG